MKKNVKHIEALCQLLCLGKAGQAPPSDSHLSLQPTLSSAPPLRTALLAARIGATRPILAPLSSYNSSHEIISDNQTGD
eukprot:136007-Amphidinium_carterae.1